MKIRYVIKTKRKSYFPLDKWMTLLEMRAFGWKPRTKKKKKGVAGENSSEKPDLVTEEKGFFTFLEFRRVSPYTDNAAFVVLELLMRFVSWIRRMLVLPIWLASIICVVCGIVGFTGLTVWGIDAFIFAGIAIFVLSYAPSLLLSFFGWGFRKVFDVDEDLKKELKRNGYEPDQNL